jgi:tryptophan 2,3-dioxygenase
MHLTGIDGAGAGGPLGVAEEMGVVLAAAAHGTVPPGPHSVAQKLVRTGDLNGLRLLQRSLATPSLRDTAYGALLDFANAHGKAPGRGDAWLKARAREWAKDQAAAAAAHAPCEYGIDGEDAARVLWAVARLYRDATKGALRGERDRALFDLVEALLDYDQAFRNLRTVHIHMVLRVIGGRPGTGGSTGARYLRSTLDYEFFPLLWRARDHIEGP